LPTKAARLLAAEVTEGHGAKMTGVGGAAPADGGVVALLADVEHMAAAAEKAALDRRRVFEDAACVLKE
jgi:hypothetical protein